MILKEKSRLPPFLESGQEKCVCLPVVKRISVSSTHAPTRLLLPSLALRFFPKVDISLSLLFSP